MGEKHRLCLFSPSILVISVFAATASCQTSERGMLDGKNTTTAPVCHPSCLTLTGTMEGVHGGKGGGVVSVLLQRLIPLKNLFNSLIENVKSCGTFYPVGEIKELELHKTHEHGLEPRRSWITLAN